MAPGETVFVGLGSNLGDSARILLEGWDTLGTYPEISLDRISSPYLSSPVGMASTFWFTNAVGRLRAGCGADRVLDILLEVEARLGRVRDDSRKGYQDRRIDLDLLYFGALIVAAPRLTLPHPRRRERLFVLAPLAEIAPDFIDPETGLAIAEMHRQLGKRIRAGAVEAQEISGASWPAGGRAGALNGRE